MKEMKRDPFFPDSILPHLGKTMKLIDCYIQDHMSRLDGSGLTKTQFILLKILLSEGDQPQYKLASITERNKASLTRLLVTLEKKKYITRYSSEHDLRSKFVALTAKGEAAIRRTFPAMKQLLSKLQEGLTSEEVNTVINVMYKVRSNIESLNQPASN